MRIKGGMAWVSLLIITVLVVVAVAAAYWAYMTYAPQLTDQKLITELEQIQVAAQLYRYRIDSYSGVCSEAGARDPFMCNDSDEAYAVAVRLSTGYYLCADSTGYSGQLRNSLGKATKCGGI